MSMEDDDDTLGCLLFVIMITLFCVCNKAEAIRDALEREGERPAVQEEELSE